MSVYSVAVPGFRYNLKHETVLDSGSYDAIVYAPSTSPSSKDHPEPIRASLQKASKLDAALETEGGIFEVNLPAGRLIYSPTGPLNDYNDVRSYKEAAKKGIKRVLKAGAKAPLFILPQTASYPCTQLVSLLGALEALYLCIQFREDCPDKSPKIQTLGVWGYSGENVDLFFKSVVALETGRCVARDIGGGDPERMAPPKVVAYVKEVFPESSGISLQVIDDQSLLEKDYPLFAAVNRGASVVDRHRGRIVYLTYEPKNATDSLLLVGKGVTYDTGGADIKAGGVMAGMSRDKCGAAAVAGFLKVVSLLKPSNLKVVGALGLVRNSVGSNCYVSDELIMSRAKKRVRVGNTDAEGRMIMADILCYMKEIAKELPNPHLMTIATLTGHAALVVGNGYTIIVDNGVANKEKHAQKLQETAENIGDPFEISHLRTEDFAFNSGKLPGDDLLQSNNMPSSRTPRGHQIPSAFLIQVTGLDEFGLNSQKPMKYSHLDIAGSSGMPPDEATGSPLLALAAHYLKDLKAAT